MAPEQAVWQLGGALLLGLALGLLYDLYRVWFRRAGRLRGLGDIAWWMLALAVTLPVLYRIDGLALRGFTLALAALGAAGEQLVISPHFYPLGESACALLVRMIAGLLRMLARALELALLPPVWLAELALRVIGAVWRVVLLPLQVACYAGSWLTRPIRRHIKRVVVRLRGMWSTRLAKLAARRSHKDEETAAN